MSVRVRGVVGGLVAALLWGSMAGAQDRQPPIDPVVERLSAYFEHPSSPETYRALSGMGNPATAPRLKPARFYLTDDPDTALAISLFPSAAGQSYLDPKACRLEYALRTLKTRIAELGADHPYVRQWIQVQRAVFSACDHGYGEEPLKGVVLPVPMPLTDAALVRLQTADRAYQAASLMFYMQGQTEALAAFDKIARGDSVHRPAARYMVAAIRAGTDGQEVAWPLPKPLASAAESIREIQAILADPAMAPFHPQAQELLGWVAANAADRPTRRAQVLATLAALEVSTERLDKDASARQRYALAAQDVDNLHRADDVAPIGWWLTNGPPTEFTASQAFMEATKTDPLAAWILFGRSYVQGSNWAAYDAYDVPPQGWSELAAYAESQVSGLDGDGFAWTRQQRALSRNAYDPALWSEVEEETAKAGQGDDRATAALAFDFYHQVRQALTGKNAEAFETALDHVQAFPYRASAPYLAACHDGLEYLMSTGRVAQARRWRDAVPQPNRSESPFDFYFDQYDSTVLLQILAEDEAHFAAALAQAPAWRQAFPLQNGLSIAALRSLATRSDLPRPLRARFARVAWSRTYALGRTVDADLNHLTRDLNPEMASWTSKPGRPVRPGDRRALLDVLRTPGMNILILDTDRDSPSAGAGQSDLALGKIDLLNHDDNNWWCAWKRGRNRGDLQALLRNTFYGGAELTRVNGDVAYGLRDELEPVLASSFAFRAQDPAEIDALAQIPCAPKMLGERAIAWVERPGLFETRQGQAEALALAVKTTRYGCYSDGPHAVYSKAAWLLLHQRFGQTEWASKTKYWFSCLGGGTSCPPVENP